MKGVRTHGGGLWEKKIGPEITDELLDLIVYYYTHEEQVKALVEAAQRVLPPGELGIYPLEALEAALAPFENNEAKK